MSVLPLVFIIVATCCVLSWSQTAAPPNKPDDIAEKCLKQANVTLQYLNDFINGKIKPATVTPNFKCFIRCHMEARGYMKNGQLMEANIAKAAENITNVEMVRKIMGDCKIANGKNNCNTSFDVFMCFVDELP